jgi:F-type H+-transporting ATPase subunit a
MMATWATMLIILVLAGLIRLSLSLKPTKLQLVTELIIDFFHKKMSIATLESKKETTVFLPIVLTVFLLFLIGNQFSLLPVINNITYNDVPLFRTPSADFSLTIAATLLIIVLAHAITIIKNPGRYFLNYTKLDEIFKVRSLKETPKIFLEIFLAITEVIGELAKVVSMSARLFGNVVAGELMVLVIGGLAVFTFYLIPIPFIFLGSFAGLIQAFVFGLLGVQYAALTLNSIKRTEEVKK